MIPNATAIDNTTEEYCLVCINNLPLNFEVRLYRKANANQYHLPLHETQGKTSDNHSHLHYAIVH